MKHSECGVSHTAHMKPDMSSSFQRSGFRNFTKSPILYGMAGASNGGCVHMILTGVSLCLVIGQHDDVVSPGQVLCSLVKVVHVAHHGDVEVDEVAHVVLQSTPCTELGSRQSEAQYVNVALHTRKRRQLLMTHARRRVISEATEYLNLCSKVGMLSMTAAAWCRAVCTQPMRR